MTSWSGGVTLCRNFVPRREQARYKPMSTSRPCSGLSPHYRMWVTLNHLVYLCVSVTFAGGYDYINYKSM